jgi:hypothetical protein
MECFFFERLYQMLLIAHYLLLILAQGSAALPSPLGAGRDQPIFLLFSLALWAKSLCEPMCLCVSVVPAADLISRREP